MSVYYINMYHIWIDSIYFKHNIKSELNKDEEFTQNDYAWMVTRIAEISQHASNLITGIQARS